MFYLLLTIPHIPPLYRCIVLRPLESIVQIPSPRYILLINFHSNPVFVQKTETVYVLRTVEDGFGSDSAGVERAVLVENDTV